MAMSRSDVLKVALVLLTLTSLGYSAESAGWSYRGENGPSEWARTYPECGGEAQSPINIKIGLPVTHPRLFWKNYDNIPSGASIKNNGHSLVVTTSFTSENEKPELRVDNKIYQLNNVHFHWGRHDFEGSEHAFGYRKYPLEMHAVHYRVIDGAVQNEIVVVAVLFDILPTRNPGMERFLRHANNVSMANTSTIVEPFPWSSIVPVFTSHFYTYQGSLTTPPCSQVVTWLVRKQLSWVSHEQMRMFRNLKNEEGEEISPNVRPLQPRNSRPVFYVLPY